MQIELTYAPGALRLTDGQAKQLFTDAEIAAGERRGVMRYYGPWQIITGYSAIAIAEDFRKNERFERVNPRVIVFGERALSKPRSEGYVLEGIVSVQGKRYRGFTSSRLFKLPNGKLIDCAIIYVCGYFEKEN